jgi:hypothetical protein
MTGPTDQVIRRRFWSNGAWYQAALPAGVISGDVYQNRTSRSES